ncbi:MAG: hypothetical protein M1282_14815 [Chloroflexi bacterium]|nr:hypothetical protein [Chloroflexota bacterium]
MTSKQKLKKVAQKPTIEANISGNISGQVAIGSNIQQVHSITSSLTDDEIKELSALVEKLREQVMADAPPDKRGPALYKTKELEQAINATKPDVSTMAQIRDWFVKNIPQLAGAVTGLVVNPLVGKLVEAAGDAIAHEFKERFGVPGS